MVIIEYFRSKSIFYITILEREIYNTRTGTYVNNPSINTCIIKNIEISLIALIPYSVSNKRYCDKYKNNNKIFRLYFKLFIENKRIAYSCTWPSVHPFK
ncbi:hypothetical protein SAMN04488128_10432 [Chitinophaga eiseniae]|uniref:Uncharacterized protein n=1 Tax=Chitinophaga eiseniae TaxID=634771 RepID=A0A1T4T660_9BACT|nr:hypothetical protein SAMN04488128_10432 [Chitinophaga eiseniae]